MRRKPQRHGDAEKAQRSLIIQLFSLGRVVVANILSRSDNVSKLTSALRDEQKTRHGAEKEIE